MDRLTTRIDGIAYGKSGIKRLSKEYHRRIFECTALVERLAEYEDAEEQGLLIHLPCKVGERLFVIWNANGNWRIVPVDVKEISLGIYMTMKMIQVKVEQISSRGRLFNFYNNDFGEVIFHSREEAEQKLKEMEAENENSRK